MNPDASPEVPDDEPAPQAALGDLPADDFRAAMHRVADLVADYLEDVGERPVMSRAEPGELSSALSAEAPRHPEDIDQVLDDVQRLVEPGITHWNHPGFLGYFAISGSGPGILGEALAAAFNVNAMVWRTSPAATELERRVCAWLQRLLELPEGFAGHINDTASTSTLVALTAARDAALEGSVRHRGLAGRDDLGPLVIYTSDQAHSSVDKAAIVLGIGLDNVRRIATDEAFRMDPRALAAAVQEDRAAGRLPLAVMPTVGTTSTTAIDPVAEVAAVARQEDLWMHVDGAYGGIAAICPEHRAAMAGIEAADSMVVNPHKWLFTPIDCSVLFVRDEPALKRTFSLVPEYLKTQGGDTHLMDLGFQLGRRFRALKLWMVIRTFGVEGLQARIREHCRLARLLASWVEDDPDFEMSAPVPLSLVCFRARQDDPFNEELLARVNAAGPVLLSHTKLRDRYVLRAAVGNIRTTEDHIRQAWELIRTTAAELDREAGRES